MFRKEVDNYINLFKQEGFSVMLETDTMNTPLAQISPEDVKHVQNSKLLHKLLWLVDSGSREIRTVYTPVSFIGILSYEAFKGPTVDIVSYKADYELNGARQWKVWVREENKLVFHASEIDELGEPEPNGPIFIWRGERPHGRLPPSNAYWSDGVRLPPITESEYELHVYARGEWEKEITRITKGIQQPGSKFFDTPYRSKKQLRLTRRQLLAEHRFAKPQDLEKLLSKVADATN